MSSVIQRVAIDEEKLKEPICCDHGEAGLFLQYDPIYDQIKEARREDDETLSQGIWQTELKRADWFLVESLCIDSLQTKTKDLQILAWLCEVWTVLDHISGLQRGVQLTEYMVRNFWQSLHPLPEGEDHEYRLRIFDWFHEIIANRLMFVPIVQGPDFSMNLADWISAVNMDTIAKRSTDGKNMLAKAEASNKMTLNRFRKNLKRSAPGFLETVLKETENAQKALESLLSCLKEKLGLGAPIFAKIKLGLDDILRICKTGLELKAEESKNRAPTPPQSQLVEDSIENLLNTNETPHEIMPHNGNEDDGTLTVSGRKDAYQALADIGAFLKSLDPHSPAPYLIDLIVKWQDKSLVDILSDLPKETDGPHQLLRVLGNAANQPTPPVVNVVSPPAQPMPLNPSMFSGMGGG